MAESNDQFDPSKWKRQIVMFKKKTMGVDDIIKKSQELKVENQELKSELSQKENSHDDLLRQLANSEKERSEVLQQLNSKNGELLERLAQLEKDRLKTARETEELRRTNNDLKLLVSEQERKLAEKNRQNEQFKAKAKTKNAFTQTHDEQQNPAASKSKTFISFFKPKALFPKAKPKKNVKFFKKGQCRKEIDYACYGRPKYLPGFIPHDLPDEMLTEFVLPHASVVSKETTGTKRKASPVTKSPNKKTKRTPKEQPSKSPKKGPSTPVVSKASIIPSSPPPAPPPPPAIKRTTLNRNVADSKSVVDQIKPLGESKSKAPLPSFEHVEESNQSAKKVLSKKSTMSVDELIPLGGSNFEPPKRNERSVSSFKLTPEALKAIQDRKVQNSNPRKRPLPAAKPMSAEVGPTYRKRSAPSRPGASIPQQTPPAPPPPKQAASPVADHIEDDLQLTDEDDDNDDEIVVSPTKSSRAKRIRIDDDDEPEDGGQNVENVSTVQNNEMHDTPEPAVNGDDDQIEDTTPVAIKKGEAANDITRALDAIGMKLPGPFLEHMLAKFNVQTEKRKTDLAYKHLSARCKDDFEHTLGSNRVAAQLGRLMKSPDRDIFINVVKQLTSDVPNITIHRRFIVQHIYLYIRDEKEWEGIELTTQGGPKMTRLQRKLLMLLVHLEPTYDGIIAEMKFFLSEMLFADRLHVSLTKFKLPQMANLSRFLLILNRHLGDDVATKQFIYDTLFYRNTRSHVMLTVMLDTWPQIFCGNLNDIFAETIIWVIYNSGPAQSRADMRVPEVKEKLLQYCGVRRPKLTGDELIKKIIGRVETDQGQSKSLRFLAARSLLFISRVENKYEWSFNHIIRRLFDALASNESPTTLFVAWVVETIGLVTRFFPDAAREQLIQIFEQLTVMINQDRVDKDLEEACIRAIAMTGHHLQFQACKFLLQWKPKYELSVETEDLLANFVGTRCRRFSERTVTINRKAEVRKGRNKVKK